ncbi:MAG TPA: nuclear transport factor 2 family protein [Caulobacteraceae bacterium]|jgi:ketosteroid isomerase-like protein
MLNRIIAGAAAAALVAGGVSGCSQGHAVKPGANTGKIAETIMADQTQLVADFNAHDAARFASHAAEDFVGMSHGAANVTGSEAELAVTKTAFASDPSAHLAVSNGAVEVAAGGDMAVYRATYAYTGTNPATGKPIAENGNYIAGYKTGADGDWKIAWSVVSDAPAPAVSS